MDESTTRPILRHQVFDLLKAQKADVLLQPQAAHQVLAFLCVGRVFVGGPAIQPSASGIWLTTRRMARMKVLMSLIGTTRPIRHSTGGGRGRAQRAQRCKAGQADAVGMLKVRSRPRAVGHLAQAVGLVQRDDGVGRVVAVAAQPLEEADPHLAEVRQLGRVALEDVAVVADPLALEQVDLAFLGVDAVFGQDQRRAARLLQQAAEKARVAGGGAVQRAPGSAAGHAGQQSTAAGT
jgi:hypothetical protein